MASYTPFLIEHIAGKPFRHILIDMAKRGLSLEEAAAELRAILGKDVPVWMVSRETVRRWYLDYDVARENQRGRRAVPGQLWGQKDRRTG